MTGPDGPLVNPYRSGRRGRVAEQLSRAGVLRRRFTQLVVSLVSLALIGGALVTSCGADTAAAPDAASLGPPVR